MLYCVLTAPVCVTRWLLPCREVFSELVPGGRGELVMLKRKQVRRTACKAATSHMLPGTDTAASLQHT
jgi:hypothetical protein